MTYSENKQMGFIHVFLVVLVLVAAISAGLYFFRIRDTGVLSTTAADYSIEVEKGTITGKVSIVNDSNASGGQYVKLGN